MGRFVVVLAIPVLSCTGACGGHAAKPIDAPPIIPDAAPRPDAFPDASFGAQTVTSVDCSTVTTPDAIVLTSDSNMISYTPAQTTIKVGQIIEFEMSIIHDLAPGPGPSDSGLNLTFQQTACLKFTVAGTFNFHCTTHAQMLGSVTVTAD